MVIDMDNAAGFHKDQDHTYGLLWKVAKQKELHFLIVRLFKNFKIYEI